jgi:hypothetical protein
VIFAKEYRGLQGLTGFCASRGSCERQKHRATFRIQIT